MSLDWANERYIRVYTRDTDEWLVLPWQARAVWPLLMRKAERSGFVPARLGSRGVAVLIGLPADVVEVGIAGLLEDGCLAKAEGGYIIPNFLEAQETRSSDAQRQRDSRERRRAEKMKEVTGDVDVSQNVTAASPAVTSGHLESPTVTLYSAVPCCADLSLSQAAPACDPPAPTQVPVAKGSAVHGAPGKIAQLVQHAIDRIDTARRQLDPDAQQLVSALRVGQPARDLMDRLMPIDERERRKVLDHVLDVVIAEAKADGAVDKLSLGFVAGERAWPMHVAATVGGSIRRPRSPPPVPPRRDPARGSVPARVDSHTDGTGIVRIEKEF